MGTPDAFARLFTIITRTWQTINKRGNPNAPQCVIQTHDFPDHDAVAAAFGLASLLSRKGCLPRILYRGRIRSHSLRAMINQLSIPMENVNDLLFEDFSDLPCVIVDGSPNNANTQQITRLLLGVIDHHPNPGNLSCPFQDIRTSYGSCATIIADYWAEAEIFPDRNTATALLMGIQMDTDFLSRRVSPADLDAHHRLFFRADWQFGIQVGKASLSINDLPAFQYAVSNARTQGILFFTVLSMDCSQELISIIADFFLRLREILVTVIVETGGQRQHISVRSREADISASAVIKLALSGIGQGGGHDHMAGGVIDPEARISEEDLFERFLDAVDTAQENQ